MTGSLQTKNNTYYAVINLYVDGKRKPKWVSTGIEVKKGNKRKADAELDRIIQLYDTDLIQPSIDKVQTELFLDYLLNWLKMVKPTIEISTYNSYRNMIEGRITRYFAPLRYRLSDITPKMINDFYQSILQDGYKTNTVIHYHAILRKALQSAMKLEIILTNPCDRVDKPKKNQFIDQHYSTDEIAALFDALTGDPLEIVVCLAAYYGLRRSEALGVRWSAIDFDSKKISINQKVLEVKENGKFIPLPVDKMKNSSSYRSLPLIPAVEKKLLLEKQKQEMFKRLFKNSYNKDFLDYVCVDQQGMLLRPNYVTEHFKWLLKKYDLKVIRFHDLRHTCASLLLANGVPMKAIQEWLGHSDFGTTANTYSHLDYKAKEQSAETMERVFGCFGV